MHPQHVRACFPSYDYHRLCTLVHPSTASRAEVWFSQFLFCMAWLFNSFRFYFIDFLILSDKCPYTVHIHEMRRIDLVKSFFEKGVCSPTGWAIRVFGYYFNFKVSFTQKFCLTWRDLLRIFIDYNSDLQMPYPVKYHGLSRKPFCCQINNLMFRCYIFIDKVHSLC